MSVRSEGAKKYVGVKLRDLKGDKTLAHIEEFVEKVCRWR